MFCEVSRLLNGRTLTKTFILDGADDLGPWLMLCPLIITFFIFGGGETLSSRSLLFETVLTAIVYLFLEIYEADQIRKFKGIGLN